MWKFTNFLGNLLTIDYITFMEDDENKDKDNCFIYRLEIKYNEKTGIVEHITECIVESEDKGPINTNWDYLEEYWDSETLNMLCSLYEVAEA
jgi:hypothetical protein|tara:strand:- start:8143 stop:8418 length:276 start_codon:yes stop_codon:yes gene_type:complete